MQLRIAGCNDAYLRTVGRARREDIVGETCSRPSRCRRSRRAIIVKASLDPVIASGQRDDIALVPYGCVGARRAAGHALLGATHTPLFDRAGHGCSTSCSTPSAITELHTLRKRNAGLNIAEAGVLLRAREVQAASEQIFAEAALMRTLFADAPGFVAVLTGPNHIFRLANDAYSTLVGRRDLIGRSLAEALPEVVEQGFLDLLDMVRDSGEPYIGRAVPVMLHRACRRRSSRTAPRRLRLPADP